MLPEDSLTLGYVQAHPLEVAQRLESFPADEAAEILAPFTSGRYCIGVGALSPRTGLKNHTKFFTRNIRASDYRSHRLFGHWRSSAV